MIPKIRMKFNSEQDAYDFYNSYARKIDFSVRGSSCHYVETSKIIKSRTFYCSQCTGLQYFLLQYVVTL
jgi:zinc finger SWIM domain-containing protein 3